MKQFPKQKWLLLLVVILLLTNLITLSIYWLKDKPGSRNNNNPASREKRMGQFMVNEMKFDKAQEDRYWKMRDTLMSQQRGVMDSIRSSKKRFFDLLKQQDIPQYDSLLDVRSNEINTYQKKLDLLTFHHFEQVRSLCTPDQLQKFDTVIQEIVNRMTSFKRPSNKSDSTKVKEGDRNQ